MLTATNDRNKALASVGQLKAVFSLRFENLPAASGSDADADGLTDDEETLMAMACRMVGNTQIFHLQTRQFDPSESDSEAENDHSVSPDFFRAEKRGSCFVAAQK